MVWSCGRGLSVPVRGPREALTPWAFSRARPLTRESLQLAAGPGEKPCR